MGILDTIKAWINTPDQQQRTLLTVEKMADRAAAGDSKHYGGTGEVYPTYRYGREALWDLSMNTDVLRITQGAVVREILRNGLEVTESDDAPNQNLPDQPSNQPTDPNYLRKRMQVVNDNGQSFQEVAEECERDLEIYDDLYLQFRKEWHHDDAGNLVPERTRLLEILRADPVMMGKVQNRYDQPGHDDEGNELSFCSVHRHTILKGETHCRICGRQTLRAHYVHSGPNGKVYYAPEEMIHASKYVPSKRLGTSPVVSVWMKVRTLLFMDKYIMQMYDGQRPPKGILAFKTMNPDKVQAQLDAARERMKTDPHFPVALSIPNADNGKDFIQFIDLMRSLNDLQHTEVRNELRSQIGAVYGVEPIFQNDISTGGGLNNEGLQITVTNRAVEWGQEVWNRKLLPRVCEELGGLGLQLTLAPSEEQDEAARLQRQTMALQNAGTASDLGLRVEWDDNLEEAVIHAGPVQKKDPFASSGGFQPPNQNVEPSGTPTLPSTFARGEAKKAATLGKSRVYLKPGEEPPEGVSVQTGPSGGRYYERKPSRRRLSELLETDPEDLTDEELEYLQERMESDEVAYTADSLEQAKRWLSDHPQLRERYGKNYYEFAVEVARAIEEGYDPNTIDWQSMDSTIPLSEALEELREKPMPMAMAKNTGWTRLSKKLKSLISEYSDRWLEGLSDEETTRVLERLRGDMIRELESESKSFFAERYQTEVEKVERELGQNLQFGVVDQNTINLLSSQPVLYDAYAGLTDELIGRVNEIIVEGSKTPGGLDRRTLEKQIEQATQLTNSRAENIARTETSKIASAARKNTYQKDPRFDTFKFVHLGPDDHRTTPTSKRIKSRIGEGVSWDEYVQIITEESSKDFPEWTVDPDAPVSHYQSRHVPVRRVQ